MNSMSMSIPTWESTKNIAFLCLVETDVDVSLLKDL